MDQETTREANQDTARESAREAGQEAGREATAGAGRGGRLRTTRIDFGDGVRLSPRSMLLVVLVALVPVISAIGVAVILAVGTGQPVTGPDDTVDPAVGDSGDSAGSGDSGDSGGSGDSGDSGDSGAVAGGAVAGDAVAQTSQDDAADALRDAGLGRVGAVEGAWTWTDGDSQTLLAVTRRVTRRNGNFSARAVTLRVTTVADPDGAAKVLATLEDPGQTCPQGTEMNADLDPRDVVVRDLDGDGVREALVGWAHRCGPDIRRQVTVLAGTSVYAVSGQGAVVAEPDPPIADWPDGFLDTAVSMLDTAG